ncbi:DUF1858 domain-containing protein, partial [Candidatus Micrarchaeota archaeon]|nr:DUF1858 domain-containing protein [Candidatus Micrarchaeota archaeon]
KEKKEIAEKEELERKEKITEQKKEEKLEKEITKEINIGELVKNFPEAVPLLFDYGVHCVGCHVAAFETLEQGLTAHGYKEEQIEKIVKELNEKVKAEKEGNHE